MFFSIIIPVYNRPSEIDELLNSLQTQTRTNFEVIIVEDGSTISSSTIVDKYAETLPIKYFQKTNSGPAQSRNVGVSHSTGDYLIFLDSDCILPPDYLKNVITELEKTNADAFGGPDRADDSFTPIQKAINYSMTSFFTTGGIRGGKKKLDRFFPRSFNFGIKKSIFLALDGYSDMRFGEDIDLSIRIYNAGYSCQLFPDAWVYHKRRTDFKKFFKQVHNSGIARINLYQKYPNSLKYVHCLPAVFTLGLLCLILLSIYSTLFLYPIALFPIIIFIDSSIKNKNAWIGLLSVIASFVQLIGYGSGFIIAWFKRIILRKNYLSAFDKNFYK